MFVKTDNQTAEPNDEKDGQEDCDENGVAILCHQFIIPQSQLKLQTQ